MTELNLEENFKEWSTLIDDLSDTEKEYFALKEKYNQLSQKILEETDFKTIYGKNNETIRKNHIKNELSDILDDIKADELAMNYAKRRIDYLKSMVNMKIELIKYG